jgi:hypothetical protein
MIPLPSHSSHAFESQGTFQSPAPSSSSASNPSSTAAPSYATSTSGGTSTITVPVGQQQQQPQVIVIQMPAAAAPTPAPAPAPAPPAPTLSADSHKPGQQQPPAAAVEQPSFFDRMASMLLPTGAVLAAMAGTAFAIKVRTPRTHSDRI